MKWIIRWLDATVAVAIVALVVISRGPTAVLYAANCGNVPCGSGFTGSYHDFVTGPAASHGGAMTVNLNGTATTVGQCTVCHTPHSNLVQSLLWNHQLSNNTQFNWAANMTTMAGTQYAVFPNTYAGPTAKCLSCHDGSVSRSSINWFEGQTPIPGTEPTSVCTTTGTPPITRCTSGSSYDMLGASGMMTGIHPVAMPYPCGGNKSTYDGVTTGAAIVGTEFQSSPLLPIRLYQNPDGVGQVISRTVPGTCAPGFAGIECSSCHDVHNRENVDTDLLRGYIAQVSGYICQNCHAK